MKVAKLVTVSFITRVIVEDTDDDSTILEKTKSSFEYKINNELGEHLESIEDDTECPYDEKYDEKTDN